MRKIVLSVFTILLLAFQVSAQNQRVSGTVTDVSGETLIGVTVQLKGTNVAVATNIDGQYSINAPANGVLVFSYLGMKPQELSVGGRTVINITLEAEAQDAGTVTIIGYGSGTALGNTVGSHTSVGGQQLTSRPTPNVADALQGKVAGMQSWTSSGEPTATASIRIRGISSATMSSAPLYILDGVPVSADVFNQLNAYDIENVTVLKDAASTAIYGSRAANGVIYITSKKGRKGVPPKLTLNAFYGIAFNTNSRLDMMDAKQLIEFEEKAFPEETKSDDYQRIKDAVYNYGLDFDWEKYILSSSAPNYNLNAEVSGGGDNIRYLFSFGYYNKQGTSIRSSMDRYNFRSNIDADIRKNFRIGSNVSISVLQAESTVTGWYLNSPTGEIYEQLPYRSPYAYEIIDGELVYGARYDKYPWGWYDMFYHFDNNPSTYRQVSINGSFYEDWRPIEGLTIKAVQAMDAYDRLNEATTYPSYQGSIGNGSGSRTFRRAWTLSATNTIDYKFTLGENHNLSFLLGQEAIVYKYQGVGASVQGLTDDRMITLSNGLKTTAEVSEAINEYVFNSYFLQADYNYASKYFFSATVRRDGSSRFGPGNRWGNFYSVGGMWDLKKENFLTDVDAIDMMRLRVNYGETGNANLGDYQWRSAMSSSSAYSYNGTNGMYLTKPGNTDLSWETVAQFNIGLTARLFDRVNIAVDWYNRATLDMLMDVPYSASTGFTSGDVNVGRLRNRGVELDVSVDIISNKDFYWGVNANASYNKNKVMELFNGLQEYSLGSTGLKLEVGQPLGTFSEVRRVGVDPHDGSVIWLDKDGNMTKEFSDDHAVVTNMNRYADWTGGFGTVFTWKNLSLAVDFVWCGPKYLWLNEYVYSRNSSTALSGSNREMWMMDIWTAPGQITEVPKKGTEFQFDTSLYSNAAFLRLKNLSLSYTLPSNWMSRTNGVIQGARVYFTGRNLFTFTNYDGLDPEADTNGSQFRYPNSREIVFGVELTF